MFGKLVESGDGCVAKVQRALGCKFKITLTISSFFLKFRTRDNKSQLGYVTGFLNMRKKVGKTKGEFSNSNDSAANLQHHIENCVVCQNCASGTYLSYPCLS